MTLMFIYFVTEFGELKEDAQNQATLWRCAPINFEILNFFDWWLLFRF